MMQRQNSDNILSVLDNFVLDNADDIARQVADSFRKRRVEKNITRQRISELSGIPLSTVARFEQRGLIAFNWHSVDAFFRPHTNRPESRWLYLINPKDDNA